MKKFGRINLSARAMLGLLTLVCAASLIVSYFSSGAGVSIRTAVGAVVVPFQTGVNQVGRALSGVSRERRTVRELTAENVALQAQIDALQERLDLVGTDLAELDRLRKLTGIRDYYSGYETVGASVISTGFANFDYTVMIDKGEADGIRTGQTVLNEDGLVGLVVSVAKNFAIVRTLIDHETNVSAMRPDTLDTCIVEGDENAYRQGYLPVTFIDNDSTIENGIQLVTSHISARFACGIPIGTVTDLRQNADKLSYSARLIPAVDFAHLKNVLVVLSADGEPPIPIERETEAGLEAETAAETETPSVAEGEAQEGGAE